jgi:hypothetical protein
LKHSNADRAPRAKIASTGRIRGRRVYSECLRVTVMRTDDDDRTLESDPVGRSVPRESSGVLIIASVELWSDAIVLRTAEVTPTSNPPPVRADASPAAPRVEWQLTDDLGSEYQLSGGPPGGARGRIFGTVLFHPDVADNATTLRIFSPQMEAEAPIDVVLSG